MNFFKRASSGCVQRDGDFDGFGCDDLHLRNLLFEKKFKSSLLP